MLLSKDELTVVTSRRSSSLTPHRSRMLPVRMLSLRDTARLNAFTPTSRADDPRRRKPLVAPREYHCLETINLGFLVNMCPRYFWQSSTIYIH